MRKLLNLIGIDWYAFGDKVLFCDISGTVCCGYIRGKTEENNDPTGWWICTDITYKIELCRSCAICWVKEDKLIQRVK